MAPRYVIVGASLAGATAAITLRDEGADGTVTLIAAESEPPYERPPLSKAYLRGDAPFDKALVRPAAFTQILGFVATGLVIRFGVVRDLSSLFAGRLGVSRHVQSVCGRM